MIVKAYPLILLAIGIVINLFVLRVDPSAISLPSAAGINALVIAGTDIGQAHPQILDRHICGMPLVRSVDTPTAARRCGLGPN